ncbi:MAG: T9SS C-terminal target domain-containing protein [Flavobacteriales bacterium]|jgi:hypothetical protein|nr:T9SS C-terminal target domain-containing protein [Flavobacteriales bacterium]
MKNRINIVALLIGSLAMVNNYSAMNLVGSKSGHKKNSFQNKAAGCAQAETKRTLDYNNVSALIETGGTMWQQRSTGVPAYEVPKQSEDYLIFSGSLWVGGEDVNGQLKLAAMKFGTDGNDFWTGPLSVTPNTGNPAIGRKDFGPATVDGQTCVEYDKFYITERAEILEFNGWFETPDAEKATEYPGYTIPPSILNWPAHGDLGKFQDFYLAPFYDRDGDGVYNPGNGDYPWYDIKQEVDCRNDRQITLYGDYNMWWVFNDKGDIHTESGGEPIGMEIRGQAFAFATTDEVNNMTFYNYELINRSTQTLTNTYFAFYTDADVGCAGNDYVGCDIQRGLAYTYNKYDDDGANPGTITCNTPIKSEGLPPAVGVDFFEGPYQDNDGVDNPLTTDVAQAIAQKGIPYAGLGIGYGDGVVDNERFGMRKFVYYNNSNSQSVGDPQSGSAVQFYNYMQGLWKDGSEFFFGGTGFSGNPGVTTVATDYIMYGNTDPYNWATRGIQPPTIGPDGWTEFALSNADEDKRMVQSAGPFTLEPGAVNNITVGVIYSKAQNGNAWQSVIDMREADDKAQALFDNCFRILDGPDAPDVTLQEMDKTLILYLSNPSNSNNFNEQYTELDPVIKATGNTDTNYVFQGYKIYQVAAEDVSVSDLDNPDLARLVGQCDLKDSVTRIINYRENSTLNVSVPELQVDGANEGIYHTLKVTEDLFAQGDSRLINHKKYYYLAIAYGYNNYEDFNPLTKSGQSKPYFQGRKSPIGSIKTVVGIPHMTTPENGGSVINAQYGDGPKITRVEGRGNADNVIELTSESEAEIVSSSTPPKEITYKNGFGPVNIKVIDPLNVQGGDYQLIFIKDNNDELEEASWVLVRNEVDSIYSDRTINHRNEQIIPEWGISVDIQQYEHEQLNNSFFKTELLTSSIEFVDYSNVWLTGVKDEDGLFAQNWIRAGAVNASTVAGTPACLDPTAFNDFLEGSNPIDEEQDFEKILEGTWAPYILTAEGACNHAPLTDENWSSRAQTDLSDLSSVDIVFTSDRSKWTRVPVLESQDEPGLSWDGSTEKMTVKMKPSVDKYGKPTTAPSSSSNNPDDANYISGEGMSWFPGYAIDLQTGERLNMAFAEDSWLGNENGNDMVFNPTKNEYQEFGGINDANSVLFGGKHYVYVFRNADKDKKGFNYIGAYDNGVFFKDKLIDNPGSANYRKTWIGCMYVGVPLLSQSSLGLSDENDPYSYIESDVRIKIRVANNYRQHADAGQYVVDGPGSSQNGWYNKYAFNMDDIATSTQADVTDSIKDSIMNMINVVPNPYYAYSNYETGRLDNRIKIVNLPDECTIKIYTVSGTLVRTFTKDDNRITSIDWDLTNQADIPIAGGLYLIHVDVPSIERERILKWFGVVRPPDLKNF